MILHDLPGDQPAADNSPALQIGVQCRGQLDDLKDLGTLALLKDLASLGDAVLTHILIPMASSMGKMMIYYDILIVNDNLMII